MGRLKMSSRSNPASTSDKGTGPRTLGAFSAGKLIKDGIDTIKTPHMKVLVKMMAGRPITFKWGSAPWGAYPNWDRAFLQGYVEATKYAKCELCGATYLGTPGMHKFECVEQGAKLYEKNPDLEVSLTSSKLIHTPGVLNWAKAGFKGGTASDKSKFVNILVQGYKLPAAIARGLLDGTIPHVVKGENVVFRARFPKGWKAPNPPSPQAQRYISKMIRRMSHEGKPAKQAQAIAYSKARRAGFRVPPPPARKVAANPPAATAAAPWKHGQKIPVAKYRAWLVKSGTPQQVKDFDRAMALQKEANRPARFVLWKTNLEIPGMNGRVTLVHYGDTDEHTYKPPTGSKKGSSWYRHEWEKRKVPILVDPSGKTIITPLAKGQTAGDWLRG